MIKHYQSSWKMWVHHEQHQTKIFLPHPPPACSLWLFLPSAPMVEVSEPALSTVTWVRRRRDEVVIGAEEKSHLLSPCRFWLHWVWIRIRRRRINLDQVWNIRATWTLAFQLTWSVMAREETEVTQALPTLLSNVCRTESESSSSTNKT